jgi:hypothetical protein
MLDVRLPHPLKPVAFDEIDDPAEPGANVCGQRSELRRNRLI